MPGRNARDRDGREARRRTRAFSARQAVHAERVRRRRRDAWLALAAFVVAVGIAITAQVLYFSVGPAALKPTATATATPAPTPSASGTSSGTSSGTPTPSATGSPSASPTTSP